MPALAAPGGEKTPVDLSDGSAGGAAPAAGGNIVRTIVGLAIVIGVIYGLHWILKQIKASREERSSGQGLQTIAELPLGGNRSLHVVRAGAEVVVLGVTEQGIVPIRTYTEEEAILAGLLNEDEDGPSEQRTAAGRALEAITALRTAASNRTTAAAERPAGAGLMETLRAWTVRG